MWRAFLRRWLGRRGYPLPPYRPVTFHEPTVARSGRTSQRQTTWEFSQR
jgi:hypothetical protein